MYMRGENLRYIYTLRTFIFSGNLDGVNTLAHEKRGWEEGDNLLMTACYLYIGCRIYFSCI